MVSEPNKFFFLSLSLLTFLNSLLFFKLLHCLDSTYKMSTKKILKNINTSLSEIIANIIKLSIKKQIYPEENIWKGC